VIFTDEAWYAISFYPEVSKERANVEAIPVTGTPLANVAVTCVLLLITAEELETPLRVTTAS